VIARPRLSRQVRVLLRKELRQFLRSKNALMTSLLLPALIMVVAPLVQLVAAAGGSATPGTATLPAGVPGMTGLTHLSDLFLYVTFPLFFVLGGLMTPSLAATHTVISERERRSIELLVALPVSVTDILTAKTAANLLVAAVTLLPLFVVDAVVVLLLTQAGALYVIAALMLVLSALTASIGMPREWTRDGRASISPVKSRTARTSASGPRSDTRCRPETASAATGPGTATGPATASHTAPS